MYIWNLLLETTGDTTQPEGINWGSIVIMGVLVVAIIGLFIWQTVSGKKKQKQAQEMVNTLKIGDRVKTIGGICGFVAQINDAENTFVLETGLEENKCFIKFDKGAIYQTAPAQGNAVAAPAAEVKAEEKPAPVEEKAAAPVEEVATETVVEEKPAAKKASKKKEVKE